VRKVSLRKVLPALVLAALSGTALSTGIRIVDEPVYCIPVFMVGITSLVCGLVLLCRALSEEGRNEGHKVGNTN
jgi:hypothetical protein